MNRKGFTLVEIISVIAILSLLVIITTPAYGSISDNIKKRNYESKKSTIKSQTLSYVEKYMKDEIYQGNERKYYCFTVEYLIQNGIISSDSEEDEYIKNDVTGQEYTSDVYVQVYYDNNEDKMKLIANTINDEFIKDGENIKCDISL